MTPARITVLFTTRDGARTLPRALERHRALLPAPVAHRLVVVDNASTDATPAILAAAEARGELSVLREPGRGKNRALNRALPLVCGSDLVVLTDDDVLPEPDWLRRLWAAAQARPDHAMFGGTIRPQWPGPPPAWIFEHGVPLGVVFAATELQREGPIPADLVWGPNMAVRGAVLREGHRFDETVGPDGGMLYGMGSETEFTTRLERAGHRAWFAADAAVGHIVRAEQLDERWILGRAYRHGLGFHRYHAVGRGRLPRIAGLPPALAVRLVCYRAAARAARLLPQGLPPGRRARFRLRWEAEWLRGVSASLRAPPPAPAAAPATGEASA